MMKRYWHFTVLLGFLLTAACSTPANEVAPATPQPAATELPPTHTPEPTATPRPEPTAVPQPILFTPVNPPTQPMLPKPEADSPFDAIYTDTGAVVYHDGLFHLFYNAIHGWPPSEILVGYATSPDGLNWTRQGDEPVIRAEDVGYAGHTLLVSNVFVEDDGTWVMYFYTWPTMSGVVPSAIGRATAVSPTGPWTPDASPALEADADSWDSFSIANPYVVRHDDGTYYLYYTGNTNANLDAAIGLATSTDGMTWTKQDGPVLEAGDALWSERKIFGPKVWRTEDGWRMIFRNDPLSGAPTTLAYATSEDGLSWTVMPQATPIFKATDVTPWRAVYATDMAYLDGTYFLYAEIADGTGTNIHVLTYEGEFGE
ncbi:MAG: hypothetical protein H6658_12595 [Ardenticatenaceae bacterium]|nr:hypothetical protein [Ardenticatenaceae bacterium]